MMIQQTDSSQLANCDHIPVIDLSSIDSASLEERQKLAQTIFEACTQVGFFYIKVPLSHHKPHILVLSCYSHLKNHGIPESLVNEIHEAAARFFDLPEEEKMKFYIGNSQVAASKHPFVSLFIAVY